MSDTPRSDRAIEDIEIGDHEGCTETDGPWVNVNFARSLERELAAMTAAKDKAVEALKHDVNPRWTRHGDECASRGPAPYEGRASDDGCDCWVKTRKALLAELEAVK